MSLDFFFFPESYKYNALVRTLSNKGGHLQTSKFARDERLIETRDAKGLPASERSAGTEQHALATRRCIGLSRINSS